MIQASLTAEQFLQKRADLPDAGQWSELIRGVAVSLQPPDLEHGTAVLNLSKLFSEYLHAGHSDEGYPCFDLGLIVERRPDTMIFPAVSYFVGGLRFAELDNEATETTPKLVVELLSSQDRRLGIQDKTSAYLEMGVERVWHIDPIQQVVIVNQYLEPPRRYTEFETLTDPAILPEFAVPVYQLFVEPKWAM
ncbi:MAG: Uma2 family endonuclease [Planctomycetaceae bacterium]